jgi:hypothetical protein
VIKKTICFDLHDLNYFRARTEQAEGNRGCVSPTPMNPTKTTSKTISASIIDKPLFLFPINASIVNFSHFDSQFRIITSGEKTRRLLLVTVSLCSVSVFDAKLAFNSNLNEIFPRISIPYFDVRVN